MVVRIRLARWGARNNPFYGIVVANARAARDGKHLDRVGTYNPIPDQAKFKHLELDVERIKYWLGTGAQTSERVAWLLAKANLIPPTPKYLHKTGLLDLNEKSTWSVRVTDKEGKELAVLDPKATKSQFLTTELYSQLQKVGSPPPKKTYKLNGQPIQDKPVSDKDSAFILKQFLGI